MASNVIAFARTKADEGVTNIMAFCDGCGGQNKNRPIAAAMSYIVQSTPIESFWLCFLHKGHTENCADDIHSQIESAKISNVHHPDQWPVLIKNIDTKINMNVKHQHFGDFYDVKGYSEKYSNFYKNDQGEKIINWVTLKMLKVTKSDPYVIHFKMNYDDPEFSKIDLIQKGGKRGVKRDDSSIPSVMKKAYSNRIPISKEKYEDLIWMCEHTIIDQEHHDFFRNLPHRSTSNKN